MHNVLVEFAKKINSGIRLLASKRRCFMTTKCE